jgi:hypothetical protein
LAFDENLPRCRFFEAYECAKKGALSGPGSAEDHQRFSLHHVEADAMENLSVSVADAEIAQGNYGFPLTARK